MVAYGSKIVVIDTLSRWAIEKLNPGWTRYRWLAMLLGIVVYALLVSIPWIGMLIAGMVTLIGLGGMWLGLRTRFTKTQTAAPQLVLTPA
jgi:dolichyl-phosphate-mannose--protein O-mannosyl transferase